MVGRKHKPKKLMTTHESIRAIRENLDLALLMLEMLEMKQADGRIKVPLSLAVLTTLEIQTKNCAEVLAQINGSIR